MPDLKELLQQPTGRIKNAENIIAYIDTLFDTKKAKALACMLVITNYDITEISDLDEILKDEEKIDQLFRQLGERLIEFSTGMGKGVDQLNPKELQNLKDTAHPGKHLGKSSRDLLNSPEWRQGDSIGLTSFAANSELIEALSQLMSDKINRDRLIQWASHRKESKITFGKDALDGFVFNNVNLNPPIKGNRAKQAPSDPLPTLEDGINFRKFYITLTKTIDSRRPYILTAFPHN